MNTPICDFVSEYIKQDTLRLHMPGHKGEGFLGCENKDITEIKGADSLFEASSVIKQSEQNASTLFGCDTYYSTEGSSLCIRAMMYLVSLYAKETGVKPLVLATRNVHKTFLSAAALCDIDVNWLYSDDSSYLCSDLTADMLNDALINMQTKPVALYVTSPDYLGNTLDIKALAKVCQSFDVLLVVDNAHGEYLKFLSTSKHPIDCGATMCCGSAHKTLPVLTGGAYLHISKDTDSFFKEKAKTAMSLFASTSPSYLILQSLDYCNKYIEDSLKSQLPQFVKAVDECKDRLVAHGYTLFGDEPLKITIATKGYGYSGYDFADILRKYNIECEFCDPDFVVFMLTPQIKKEGIDRLLAVMTSISKKTPIDTKPPTLYKAKRRMSIKDAVFRSCETVKAKDSEGRILANATVSCPPAVPVIVCGEQITKEMIDVFDYYGIDVVDVVIE